MMKPMKHSHIVKISLRQTQEFADGLATLLNGGNTLKESISLITMSQNQRRFINTLEGISENLKKGKSFHQSLMEASARFPAGFVNLCAIGESSGSLAEVMNHLSLHYKRIHMLREKIITASIYPALVLLVAILAGIFLSAFILPDIMEMMESIQNTQDNAAVIQPISFIPVILFGIFLIYLLITAWYLQKRNSIFLHSILLNIPLVGRIILDWHFINWNFALELLSSQGISMDRCLAEAANTVNNSFLQKKMLYVADTVSKGETLSLILKREKLFPPILSSWLLIGERSGNIEKIFCNLRNYFEKRMAQTINLAAQLVEPFMVLIIGIIMLFLISRFLIPIFKTMGNIL